MTSTLRLIAEKTRPVRKVIAKPLRRRTVSLNQLLLGGECAISAAHYSRLINNPLRPSTPVPEWPHTKLLLQYKELGESLFQPETFEKTAYFQNAASCIQIVGHYFPQIQHKSQILPFARTFTNRAFHGKVEDGPVRPGRSAPGSPIKVRPILDSDCYEVIDGHHRIAEAFIKSAERMQVLITKSPVYTPLQQLLLDVLWQSGRCELYQPVTAPEVRNKWHLVRSCTDRFEMMQKFLQSSRLPPTSHRSYADVGCSYGWFVAQMRNLGFESYGIERDPASAKIGQVLYGNSQSQIIQSDIATFLSTTDRKFDVVSCYSVLHHFALGRATLSAEELMSHLDSLTGTILFFDTGQNHEKWFEKSLSEWDDTFIVNWIKKHTTFKRILKLGTDTDNHGRYAENYRRSLFACLR